MDISNELSSENSLPLGGAKNRNDSAEYLAISTRLLDELASSGRLCRAKIGSKTVFLVSDLNKFLNSCRVTNE